MRHGDAEPKRPTFGRAHPRLSSTCLTRPAKGLILPSKTVTVGSSVGLHARPAAIIAKAADELDCEITLTVCGEESVDAASALLIMTLGACCGDSVEVASEDQSAVDTIAALIEQDLDG